MRCIPGFVGFNEREEKREEIQKRIARARRGDAEAIAFFPTMEEWRSQIRGVLNDFRHDPQNGHMLNGVSPAEAWNAELLRSPLDKLADEERHVLATHAEERSLTVRGVVIQPPCFKQPLCYANEATGQWLKAGVRRVVAYYNLHQPELITLSDLKRQNFIAVKALILPAMSASKEQLKAVATARRGHLAAARAIAGEIKHRITSTITRDTGHDDATRELGRFHNAAVEQHNEEETDDQRMVREIRKLENTLGEPAKDLHTLRRPGQYLESIRWKREQRHGRNAEMELNPEA